MPATWVAKALRVRAAGLGVADVAVFDAASGAHAAERGLRAQAHAPRHAVVGEAAGLTELDARARDQASEIAARPRAAQPRAAVLHQRVARVHAQGDAALVFVV